MLSFLRRTSQKGGQPVAIPDGHVLPLAEAEARLAAARAAGQDSITWLCHACFLIRLGGLTILTDPWLSDWASPRPGWGPKRYVPPGLPVERLPPVDLVLLSHSHYDHLCVPTLKALARRGIRTAVVPLRLAPLVRRQGFTSVQELDWGDSHRHGGLTVTATPAIHASARGLFDRNRTLWCSYVLEAGGRKLWFGGDSGYHAPVFRQIGAAHGPFDLAMIGIGAYDPRPLMRPVHTTPEEAVAIAGDIRARRIVGMHWGTVVLTLEDPFEPPARFRAAASAAGLDQAWLLRIGETRGLAGAADGDGGAGVG
ncbi:MBL fold metallo-hydrolase [Oleisolibacter albus]|uniref:MBL fold metallo-hydrolase n=1 Tax=Oleisolibacter albus TaxID=2171757 RepID=UPI00139004CC|nr:MBL fold metallo-hydrolase [Oleisolibacter albus]